MSPKTVTYVPKQNRTRGDFRGVTGNPHQVLIQQWLPPSSPPLAKGGRVREQRASGRTHEFFHTFREGGTKIELAFSRVPAGHWVGELSSSALSTATAVCALTLADRDRHLPSIQAGLGWLARHLNPDGGWGDTVFSKSNISTTALGWAALGLVS